MFGWDFLFSINENSGFGKRKFEALPAGLLFFRAPDTICKKQGEKRMDRREKIARLAQTKEDEVLLARVY